MNKHLGFIYLFILHLRFRSNRIFDLNSKQYKEIVSSCTKYENNPLPSGFSSYELPTTILLHVGFPVGSASKESARSAGDPGSVP